MSIHCTRFRAWLRVTEIEFVKMNFHSTNSIFSDSSSTLRSYAKLIPSLCTHLSSYSCRIVLQTQTSWNGTGKCGRVCTRVSFSANSFLITYKTTLLTLHDYRESQVCAATMIRTCTGKCRNSCTRCTSFKRWINVRDRVPRFSCARTVQYHAG